MRGYAVALTIHMLGLIAVFAGFAMQHRAAARLRRARRSEDARPWADLLDVTRAMVPSGALMLLLSGGYMASRLGPTPPAWIVVAALVVVLLVGAGVALGRRFRAIRDTIGEHTGPVSAAALAYITNPITWSVHAAANGAALGTIWLMAAKPGTTESVLVVVIATLLGAMIGSAVGRRARAFQEARA